MLHKSACTTGSSERREAGRIHESWSCGILELISDLIVSRLSSAGPPEGDVINAKASEDKQDMVRQVLRIDLICVNENLWYQVSTIETRRKQQGTSAIKRREIRSSGLNI